MEQLEDKRMLATFVVNNFGDLNPNQTVTTGSLRNAIQEANANPGFDTIVFADFLFDGTVEPEFDITDIPGEAAAFNPNDTLFTINLDGREAGGTLSLTDQAGVSILGPGPGVLSIFAGGNNRIFTINDGNENVSSPVTISGVTLAFGSPAADDLGGLGGAIHNSENLTLEEVHLRNNSAVAGGAVFNATGAVSIERSLIRNNTAVQGGGGVQNGVAGQDDNLPSLSIVSSTITGNTAVGVPIDGVQTGYGGGVLNQAGLANITQSTFYGNSASIYGGGIASRGADPEDGGGGITSISSSIVVGNTADDAASVGMTDDDPPMPLMPVITSAGDNLFGATNMIFVPAGPNDLTGVDPANLFIDDPNPLLATPTPWLFNFGGVLPVFMPDVNKLDIGLGVNAAIDRGSLASAGLYDNRGRHFSRLDETNFIQDIGAAEVQIGSFVVSTYDDELDGRFDLQPVSVGAFPLNTLVDAPDLSLREALEFVKRNSLANLSSPVPPVDIPTITVPNLVPNTGVITPTIALELGELLVNFPVIINGVPGVEIDANSGSRIFNIEGEVAISNLTLSNGLESEFGGGIRTSGDLTLSNVTINNNIAAGDGGGIYVIGGTLLLDTSTVHDNSSGGSGAGIHVAEGDVTVNNSTISGNSSAFRGGGIANENGTLLVRYSTVTLNEAASTVGSGIASYRSGSYSTEIRSSIISGNGVSDVDHVEAGTDNIVSLNYNLVGSGNAVIAGLFAGAGDQTFADAMLAPLARLGGPTPVHRPMTGSTAIDMGDPNAAGLGNVPMQDQRGFPFQRIEDGIRIDIGAFEVQNGVLNVGDITMGADFATFLEALEESNLTPGADTIVLLPDWPGETFPEELEVDGSLEVVASPGQFFFGVDILVNDNDDTELSDVSFSNFRFQDGVRFLSQENLTFVDSQFINNQNVVFDNPFNPLDPEELEALTTGGVISQKGGKLTISGSRFIGNSTSGEDSVGGVIYVDDGELEINDTFLSGNFTGPLGGSGGAIYIKDSDFTADYLYLTGNRAEAATADGGALYAVNSTVTLNNAIISGNSTGGSNSEGGAIAGKNSNITLNDSSISLNRTVGSQSRGGAIFVDGGSLTIDNGNLSLNSTGGHSSSGGAIAGVGADVTLTGTNINNNEATGNQSHGGGIYTSGGNLSVVNSAVVNNSVTAPDTNGGGIFTETNLLGTQKTSIFNSTISGNTAAYQGGGIYNAGGLLEIDHSTIANNSVPYFGNGGGVASNGDSSNSRTEVHSSIIAGNLATGDPLNPNSDVDAVNIPIIPDGSPFVSQGYNVIGVGLPLALDVFDVNGLAGDQANVTDPRLGALGLNGGTTFIHSLELDSPALNAGDPDAQAGIGNVPMFDQRGTGFTRVDLGRIDVGAYESAIGPIVVVTDGPDFDGDSDVDGFDFLTWQLGFGKISEVTQADGDANNSGTVDGFDLDIWQTDYGNGAGGGILPIATSDDESLPVIAAPSEPLAQAAVLSESPVQVEETAPISAGFLAGMGVEPVSTGEALALVFDTENLPEEAEGSNVREELFAGFSTLDEDGDLVSLASSDEAESEQTAEDQVFELLGAF